MVGPTVSSFSRHGISTDILFPGCSSDRVMDRASGRVGRSLSCYGRLTTDLTIFSIELFPIFLLKHSVPFRNMFVVHVGSFWLLLE